MPTWTALTHTTGREAAEALAEAGEDLTPEPVGSGVFEIEDGSDRWEVGLYFTEAPDEVGLALLAAAWDAEPFAVSELPEVDWVAHVRRELSPVEAGRFFVHGGHDADKVPEGAEALLIEAAMAFGTGHHATTKGCLLALDRLIAEGVAPQRIVDIGCGTAVLAMAAARSFPVIVLAGDIDPQAVDVARANVIANGLDGRVECVEAVGFDHPLIENAAPFDLVFANILKQPLIDLVPDMARHLAPGGRAILSGILVTQAQEVIAAYAAGGLALERRDDLGEWSTLVVRRG
ncbi:50S ribosomal protein L11 methyltransferase [Paracoccus sp. APAP_BH8]|uniref:Ribosomal protein L11 methyltransferase n=1 Tax=Paracoccus pantotrophus TaxID=82367 RepID=A0A7H9BUQ0_PARPN|nr:50S ribosomal protein L11 methyltransferase [Paracoccus pantotrophus]MDF3853307.1 50S ribosomal protein L11 methyltransferase [Paracoccus pantotrophus]QLH14595.1 50S ribosomal protein L11 methyltransferase [Paracoccus pantotrophus]RDD98530.1 50S ribosomal protein L11 methyltransferase [Paracoccus pantotrophus]RNI18795.1 50S ribosomal protein L11 methyltransferase [Paracoccus pantotrophus]WGR64725.1 50S ribosomal protein L11 methyltransferase [Paracoccus pantotrophus]